MRLSIKLLLPILFFVMLTSSFTFNNLTASDHLSTVVINTSPEKTKETVHRLLADSQITLEYSCNYSGVIVVKIKHGFSEVADVKGYIMKKLGSLNSDAIIIFCDMHGANFSGKC